MKIIQIVICYMLYCNMSLKESIIVFYAAINSLIFGTKKAVRTFVPHRVEFLNMLQKVLFMAQNMF